MKLIDWQNPLWRKRFWTVLTVLLVVVLASHPELRLLVPMLDAIGLDVFIFLIGVQFTALLSGALKPIFYQAWRWLVPIARATDRISTSVLPLRFVRDFARYGLFNWVGDSGPQAWLRVHTIFRAARLGPIHSFKRTSGPHPA